MKLKYLLTLAGLSLCVTLSAQIKIGDNPQNIDAASVLELESNDRVLVITRISEAQMNTIVPSQGALVYNTDAQCIFYYDGTSWINLCDSLALNFTTDPIVNSASTIVITENGDDVNFEVGEISSENILDFSINSIDIQNNSITADKLAPDSVGSEELQDNTVTDAEIDYNIVTLNDFTNDAGYITSANIVSGAPNNVITDNGGAFYDNSQLVNDIAANTTAIAADNDGNPANEIQNLSLNGNQLMITSGNSVDLSPFTGTGTDDQQITAFDLDGTTDVLSITIESGNTQNLDLTGRINSSQITDGTVSAVDLANNAVETAKIANANVTPIKLQPSAVNGDVLTTVAGNVVWQAPAGGSGNPNDELNTAFAINAGNLEITDAGGTLGVPLAGLGTDDQDASEVTYDNTTSGLTATNTQAAIDEIAGAGGGNPNDELNTAFAVNAGNLEITDAGGTLGVPLTSLGSDDQDASEVTYDNTTSGLTATNTQDAIDEIAGAGGGNPNDELNTAFAINAGNLEITDAGGTFGVPLTSLGTDDQTDAEVLLATPTDYDGDTVNETNVEEALNAIAAVGGSDDQTDAEVPLDTPSDYDGDTVNETTVEEALNALDAASTDDQTDAEVLLDTPSDYDGDTVNETTVEEALNALDAASTDDQTDAEVLLDTPSDYDGDTVNETTVEEALNALSAVSGGHVGTPNSLFFAGAGGIPTDAGNNLYWDPTVKSGTGGLFVGLNGNTESTVAKVHIRESSGSTAKFFPLQIQNAAQGATASVGMLFSLDFTGADAQGAIVYERNNTAGTGFGDFHFLQNSTGSVSNPTLADAVVTITNAGDMGIGTTTPAQRLHIAGGDLQLDGDLIARNGAGSVGDVLTTTATGTEWIAGGTGSNLSSANLQQPAATNRTYDINGGNLAFIGNGNFGIGNAANPPSNKLHVAGTIRSEGGILSSDGNQGEPAYRFNSDTNTGMYSAGSDQLGFSTNGLQAIHIDNAQNVGIGTAAPTSVLETAGSFATAIESTTTNLTLDENDHTIILGGNHTITLPPAANCQGRFYIIKNPTVNTPGISPFVDNTGSSVAVIPANAVLWLQSDGINWQQVN